MVNLRLKLAAILSLPTLLLALIISTFAQETSGVGSTPFSPAPYRVGERLTYNVSFSSFPTAAHIEVEVLARGTYFGREAIQMRAHVETSGVVNVALFAINNDYITYVDPNTGLPFHSETVAREASRASDTVQDFNQPAGTIATSSKRAGIPGTYDFLSAFYRLRALPLAEGSTYDFVVRGETEEYQAELKVTGRQIVQTNVGSFNAIVSQVRVANNSKANGYRVRIFFSEDERHVPVLITAHVSSGDIRAELAGSELVSSPVSTPSATPPPSVLASPTATPSGLQPQSSDDPVLPFKVGEQLNYQIFLAGSNTPVANANFQVRGRSRYFDHDGFLLTVQAQTTNAAQRIFAANDQINSYVDPKGLLPYRTEMNIVEGKRRSNQTLTINQEYGTATTVNGEKIEIPVGTHDYVSFFYAVRTFNLTPPKRNAISILINKKPATLFVTSLKRETIELGPQKIPAIALSLNTDDPRSEKYQLRIWVSDDKRRLPLRITATTEIGVVRADLVILPITSQ
jgi:hypothetical protein